MSRKYLAQNVGGVLISWKGRDSNPFFSRECLFRWVSTYYLFNLLQFFIFHIIQLELCLLMFLFRRFTIPFLSLGIVLRNVFIAGTRSLPMIPNCLHAAAFVGIVVGFLNV
jgi:hypothetical protein